MMGPVFTRIKEFELMSQHLMYGKLYKRLSNEERNLCLQFIIENDDLDKNNFALKLNRWYLDAPTKPKHLTDMWALLMGVNSKLGDDK